MPDSALDKRHALLGHLDSVRGSYLKLVVLKQLEQDACEGGRYEELHELAENERILIDDINGLMRYIVPDLVLLRGDGAVRERMAEIESLQTSIIRKSLGLTGDLKGRIACTRRSLQSLNLLPKGPLHAHPSIVNIRA